MVRYLVKFSKGIGVKFISHLDLMRTVQRAIRRAEIPVYYSRGFNPHAEFSFATPLSVGTWSIGEYLDIKLDKRLDPELIMEKMNEALPEPVKIASVTEVEESFPSLMSIVGAASYEITLVNMDEGAINSQSVDEFLSNSCIMVTKVGKKGERIIDIRPMIRQLALIRQDRGEAVLSTLVDSGSKSNLNPELLVVAMKKYVPGLENAEIRDIKKIETFVEKNGKVITPLEHLESDYQ